MKLLISNFKTIIIYVCGKKPNILLYLLLARSQINSSLFSPVQVMYWFSIAI